MLRRILFLALISLMAVACKNGKCDDGEQNGDETGIDCGGDCAVCETCSDGIKNQDEVNIDCGGTCEPCAIEYPANGTHGTNILYIEDTINLDHADYSFRAEVPEGSTLRIKLKSVIGGDWWYYPTTNVGWSISECIAGEQDFEALNETCEVKFDLVPVTGMFQVWYYENSESVTRVGVVVVD